MTKTSGILKATRRKKPLGAVSNNYFRRLVKSSVEEVQHTQKSDVCEEVKKDRAVIKECIPSEPISNENINIALFHTQVLPNTNENDKLELELPSINSEKIVHNNNIASSTFKSLEKLKEDLARWVINFNIEHSAVSSLLKLLKKNLDINLPNDSRSLMKTRTFSNKISSVPPGSYWHYGISNAIKDALHKYQIEIRNPIKLDINIDGLPLTKSSTSQMWPILGSIINETKPCPPFVIGIYHGTKKPENCSDLMKEFILEFNRIRENVTIANRSVSLILNNIICDAPAKSFLLGVKSHNAYFGCTKCIQEGVYINGRMTYPEVNATLRTDVSFKQKLCEDYHKTVSPLEEIPGIKLVSQVPIDYMHLVCLGVMKKLLVFWIKGKKNIRMFDVNIRKCNTFITQMKKQVPHEFARKPRPLTEVDHWKATEFRLFILYTGPVLLNDALLSNSQYTHFMSLHVALRILTSENLCIQYNNYAKELLIYFVQKYSTIYGCDHITHNVHNLVHLCDDVMHNNGPLDNFSSFSYENLLHKLKKKMKCPKNPLQQIANRLQDENIISNNCYTTHFPLLVGNNELRETFSEFNVINSYTTLITKQIKISVKEGNNCFMLKNDSIIILKYILKTDTSDIILIGNKFNFVTKYYDVPCASNTVFTYLVKNVSTANTSFKWNDIKFKCMKMQCSMENNNEFVIICLLHNITL